MGNPGPQAVGRARYDSHVFLLLIPNANEGSPLTTKNTIKKEMDKDLFPLIQDAFRVFWKEHKNSVDFKLKGEIFIPEDIKGFDVQLEKSNGGDGFNYSCKSLNLRILFNNMECPYTATFVIKVHISTAEDGSIKANVEAIKDNCIYLKKL
jgi:hypothetical protein